MRCFCLALALLLPCYFVALNLATSARKLTTSSYRDLFLSTSISIVFCICDNISLLRARRATIQVITDVMGEIDSDIIETMSSIWSRFAIILGGCSA